MTITETEVIKNLKATLVAATDENQKLKQEIELLKRENEAMTYHLDKCIEREINLQNPSAAND